MLALTARSVNRKLTTLKTYYRFLETEGIELVNPLRKIIPPKTKKRLPVFVKEGRWITCSTAWKMCLTKEITKDGATN